MLLMWYRNIRVQGYPMKRADKVYEEIQRHIVEAARGGESLSEKALADRFGVSRTPVREALYRLAKEGLVDIIPSVGYLVHRTTYEDVRQVFEAREALEGMAARLAAARVTEADVRAIRAALDGVQPHLGSETAVPYMREANSVLHGTILRLARNTRIAESVRLFSAQLEHIILTLTGRERYETSYGEHLEIVDALSSRDPDAAERAMRAHISSVRHDVLKAF